MSSIRKSNIAYADPEMLLPQQIGILAAFAIAGPLGGHAASDCCPRLPAVSADHCV